MYTFYVRADLPKRPKTFSKVEKHPNRLNLIKITQKIWKFQGVKNAENFHNSSSNRQRRGTKATAAAATAAAAAGGHARRHIVYVDVEFVCLLKFAVTFAPKFRYFTMDIIVLMLSWAHLTSQTLARHPDM